MRNLNRKLAVLILAAPGLALAHAAQADHRAGSFYTTGGYHHTPYQFKHHHRYQKHWHPGHFRGYRYRAFAHDRYTPRAYGHHHNYAHRDDHDRHGYRNPGYDRYRHGDDHGYRHSDGHDRRMKNSAYAKGYRD